MPESLTIAADQDTPRGLYMTKEQIATGEPDVIAVTSQITLYLSPNMHKRWLKAAEYRKTTPTQIAMLGLLAAIRQVEHDKSAEKARKKVAHV